MKKLLFIPLVIMLVCGVTVGAFNVVTGNNNRPMTFMETFEEISNISFSVQDIADAFNDLSEEWSDDQKPTDFENSNLTWSEQLGEIFNNLMHTFLILFDMISTVINDTVKIISTLLTLTLRFFVGVPA